MGSWRRDSCDEHNLPLAPIRYSLFPELTHFGQQPASTVTPSARAFSRAARSARARQPRALAFDRPAPAARPGRGPRRARRRRRDRWRSAAGRRPEGAPSASKNELASKPKLAPVRATASTSTISASAAPLAAADRLQRALERGLGVGGGLTLLVDSPAGRDRLALLGGGEDLAARHLAQRQIDDDGRPAPLRGGERQRAGAEHRLASAPGRHGLRRVGEGERDEPGLRQPLDMPADDAEVMRAHEARKRQCRSPAPPAAGARRRGRRRETRSRCRHRSSGCRGASGAPAASHARRPCRPWPAPNSSAHARGRAPSGRRSPLA